MIFQYQRQRKVNWKVREETQSQNCLSFSELSDLNKYYKATFNAYVEGRACSKTGCLYTVREVWTVNMSYMCGTTLNMPRFLSRTRLLSFYSGTSRLRKLNLAIKSLWKNNSIVKQVLNAIRVRKEAEFVHDLVDLIENVASTRKE